METILWIAVIYLLFFRNKAAMAATSTANSTSGLPDSFTSYGGFISDSDLVTFNTRPSPGGGF